MIVLVGILVWDEPSVFSGRRKRVFNFPPGRVESSAPRVCRRPGGCEKEEPSAGAGPATDHQDRSDSQRHRDQPCIATKHHLGWQQSKPDRSDKGWPSALENGEEASVVTRRLEWSLVAAIDNVLHFLRES